MMNSQYGNINVLESFAMPGRLFASFVMCPPFTMQAVLQQEMAQQEMARRQIQEIYSMAFEWALRQVQAQERAARQLTERLAFFDPSWN